MYIRKEAKTQRDFNNFAAHLRANATHVITIPGTTYKLFFNIAVTDDIKLLKALARTTVNNGGRKRVKASPRLWTLEEFQALTTVKAAA
jgi:hypothetical protein